MAYYAGPHRELPGELRAQAELLIQLAKMADRTTPRDLNDAVHKLRHAAEAIEELIQKDLPGCVCRRIRDDGYDYLVYSKECPHHRSWQQSEVHLKAAYEKREKALVNEVRLRLVGHILGGFATDNLGAFEAPQMVANAILIADEAIRQITNPTETKKET